MDKLEAPVKSLGRRRVHAKKSKIAVDNARAARLHVSYSFENRSNIAGCTPFTKEGSKEASARSSCAFLY